MIFTYTYPSKALNLKVLLKYRMKLEASLISGAKWCLHFIYRGAQYVYATNSASNLKQ